LSYSDDLTEKIKEMEDTLELFEIIEYRKYAEMLIKSKQEIEKSMETIRKKEYSWFTAYFASKEDSSSQKQL
jgi:predicted ribosome quality control (RQC) complex YloA/Tae2 family protein